MNKRTIDISNYWITIIKDTAQFGQIAVAENPEFNRLSECIFQALEDSFIHSASEYGVKRWEKMLQIAPSAGETLEERKARILTYLNLKLPYTWRVLKQLIEGIVGAGNYELTFDNDTQTLKLDFGGSVTLATIDSVKDLLGRVVPENLVIDLWYDGVPMKYTRLEYLEFSGTQYFRTILTIPNLRAQIQYEIGTTKNCAVASVYRNYAPAGHYGFHQIANNKGAGAITALVGIAVQQYDNPIGTIIEAEFDYSKQFCRVNKLTKYGTVTPVGDKPVLYIGAQNAVVSNVTYGTAGAFFTGRIMSFEAWYGTEKATDFVPILDEDGTACFYDRVSGELYKNNGTGTLGYALKETEVAASGVYARLKNGELDVIADTEDVAAMPMTLDLEDEVTPFMHFANVGEAMEYYGIEPETEEGTEQ